MATTWEPEVRGRGALPSISFMRIAVPSWRAARPEPGEAVPGLSREELTTLFRGELGPKPRKVVLTDREQRDKDHARAIRKALYPL